MRSKTVKKLSSKELKGYDNLITMLEKDGFDEIGSGSYGDCYGKENTKFVIKVFPINRDKPYYAYLEKIKKLNNPYTPKIFKVINKKLGNHRYCIVVLERLVSYQCLPQRELNILMRKHFNIENIQQSFDVLNALFKTPIKALQKVFDIIREIIKKNDDCDYDNHEDNIMFREVKGKYFPVLIDPLY